MHNSIRVVFNALLLSVTAFAFTNTLAFRLAHAQPSDRPFVLVLGVAQDAGFPQAGCRKDCCKAAWTDHSLRRNATSLAIVDPKQKQRWMIEATPNFPNQLRMLDQAFPVERSPGLNGILLTHAHMGHYSGLAHLGREVIGAKETPVYAMPRMASFLRNNGPWGQLVRLKQIKLQTLQAKTVTRLNQRIRVTPLLVPHRDEYSETVAYIVQGPSRKILFLPDIDKWERWLTPIESVLKQVDVAYIDGTFYANGELPGRDMSKIPHPFIAESLSRFRELPSKERSKIRFIHFNHTNPVLRSGSEAVRRIKQLGFGVAEQGEQQAL